MIMKHVVIWSVVATLLAAIIGWMIAGIGAMKLSMGIAVMFGLTAAIIAYSLNQIESNN